MFKVLLWISFVLSILFFIIGLDWFFSGNDYATLAGTGIIIISFSSFLIVSYALKIFNSQTLKTLILVNFTLTLFLSILAVIVAKVGVKSIETGFFLSEFISATISIFVSVFITEKIKEA